MILKRFWTWLRVFLGLMIILILGILSHPLWLAGLVSSQISSALGVKTEIQTLNLTFSQPFGIELRGVNLEGLASIDHLRVQFDLIKAIRGEYVIDQLLLANSSLVFNLDQKGQLLVPALKKAPPREDLPSSHQSLSMLDFRVQAEFKDLQITVNSPQISQKFEIKNLNFEAQQLEEMFVQALIFARSGDLKDAQESYEGLAQIKGELQDENWKLQLNLQEPSLNQAKQTTSFPDIKLKAQGSWLDPALLMQKVVLETQGITLKGQGQIEDVTQTMPEIEFSLENFTDLDVLQKTLINLNQNVPLNLTGALASRVAFETLQKGQYGLKLDLTPQNIQVTRQGQFPTAVPNQPVHVQAQLDFIDEKLTKVTLEKVHLPWDDLQASFQNLTIPVAATQGSLFDWLLGQTSSGQVQLDFDRLQSVWLPNLKFSVQPQGEFEFDLNLEGNQNVEQIQTQIKWKDPELFQQNEPLYSLKGEDISVALRSQIKKNQQDYDLSIENLKIDSSPLKGDLQASVRNLERFKSLESFDFKNLDGAQLSGRFSLDLNKLSALIQKNIQGEIEAQTDLFVGQQTSKAGLQLQGQFRGEGFEIEDLEFQLEAQHQKNSWDLQAAARSKELHYQDFFDYRAPLKKFQLKTLWDSSGQFEKTQLHLLWGNLLNLKAKGSGSPERGGSVNFQVSVDPQEALVAGLLDSKTFQFEGSSPLVFRGSVTSDMSEDFKLALQVDSEKFSGLPLYAQGGLDVSLQPQVYKISVEDFDFRFGSSQVDLFGNLVSTDQYLEGQLKVTGKKLNLDEVLSSVSQSSRPDATLSQSSAVSESHLESNLVPSSAQLAKQLENKAFDFDWNVNRVVYEGIQFDQSQVELQLAQQSVDLKKIRCQLNGGTIEVQGNKKFIEDQSLDFRLNADQVNLDVELIEKGSEAFWFFKLVKDIVYSLVPGVTGRVKGDFTMTSSGLLPSEILEGAKGQADFSLEEAQVTNPRWLETFGRALQEAATALRLKDAKKAQRLEKYGRMISSAQFQKARARLKIKGPLVSTKVELMGPVGSPGVVMTGQVAMDINNPASSPCRFVVSFENLSSSDKENFDELMALLFDEKGIPLGNSLDQMKIDLDLDNLLTRVASEALEDQLKKEIDKKLGSGAGEALDGILEGLFGE